LVADARSDAPRSRYRSIRRATENVATAALQASESSLHLAHLPAPPAPLTEFRDLSWLNDGHAPACLAIDAEHVAMPLIVADRIEPLAAHGLRLTDQMRAERAVMSAARARTAAGSRTNMACLPIREGRLCSLIVPSRKMVFAVLPSLAAAARAALNARHDDQGILGMVCGAGVLGSVLAVLARRAPLEAGLG
jgi:hypothetical protein